MNWAFYDGDGKRALPNVAALKVQEIRVDRGPPPLPGFERLARIEYRNAQRVDGAGPLMTFTRRRDMFAWFKARSLRQQ
jgi:hypothetical protein